MENANILDSMIRTTLLTIFTFTTFSQYSLATNCTFQQTYSFHLDSVGIPQLTPEYINFTAKDTTLNLRCQGKKSEFSNISWIITDSIEAPLTVTSFDDNVLTLNLPCSPKNCNPFEVTCRGRHEKLGDFFHISVSLRPQCSYSSNSGSYKLSIGKNETDAASNEATTATSLNEADMEYLGVIIGFSVCFVLGLLSALVVCIQKQCNSRKWSKLWSKYCCGYQPVRRNLEEADQRNSSGPTHMNPMMRMYQKKMRQGQQVAGAHDV